MNTFCGLNMEIVGYSLIDYRSRLNVTIGIR